MSYRLLICGSRNWRSQYPIQAVILGEREMRGINLVVVHGDCPTGADRIASQLCDNYGIDQEKHPADWKQYGRAAGPIRNQEMAKLGVNAVWAFKERFDWTFTRGGTEHMVKITRPYAHVVERP